MKLLKSVSLFIITFLLTSCATKDIFKDPSLLKDGESAYRANGENIHLPTFFRLPPEHNNISFKFEKAGGIKPVEITFTYSIDGWKSNNGKSLPFENAGIALDFHTGKAYQIPVEEVKKIFSNFTADDVTIIKATQSKNDSSNFVKLAVVDGQKNYGKEEIARLNLLNSSVIEDRNATTTFLQEEKDPNSSKNVVIIGKPVITAAANSQYDRLLHLLAEGGNINEIEDETGDNALIKVVRNGDLRAANMLLDRKINPKVVNKLGQTALHIASDIGFYDLSKKLLDAGLNPNDKDVYGNSSLMYAAASPNPYLASLLVERGARLEDKNKNGDTPSALAAYKGNTKTIEELSKKGADLKATDNDGNSIVMKAVSGGNLNTLQTLIDLNAPVDTPNKNSVRPIHTSVRSGNTDMTSLLLDKGANVNAQDHGGNTPLMLAAASGDSDMASLILAHNPDLTIKNNEDKTAYNIAGDNNHMRLQRVIGQSMEKLDDMTLRLFQRVAANDVEGATLAIERGAIINSPDLSTGNTALFTAVANNYDFMTDKLLQLGADVNHLNNKGNSPLIVAVTSADNNMVMKLLKAGANPNMKNSNGDTALIWAVKFKNIDMVRSLLTAGANPNEKNNDGVSPYLIAYNEGPAEIRNILQAAGGRR